MKIAKMNKKFQNRRKKVFVQKDFYHVNHLKNKEKLNKYFFMKKNV